MNVLREIVYRPLSDAERERTQTVMSLGNLIIEALAKRPDLPDDKTVNEKRTLYRQVILNGRCDSDLSPGEIKACMSLHPCDREMVERVETVKWRVIEGHVAKVMRVVRQKVSYARFYRNKEDRGNLYADLSAEALHGLLHAIYTYTDRTTPFNNFMTTVLHRWLGDYCEKQYPTIRLPEDLVELIGQYYQIRSHHREKGINSTFEDITRQIVETDLRNACASVTDSAIEEAMEMRREKFLQLRAALKKTVSVAEVGAFLPDRSLGDEMGQFMKELTENKDLTPFQRACLLAKLSNVSLTEVAEAWNTNKTAASRAFKEAKRLVAISI